MLQGHEKECGDFAKVTAFERYGIKTSEKPICIMSTGLSRPGLACSADRKRIKLLKGYVSKSSAALNPLTITQLACERPQGRSRIALRGPAHQLAVHMRIIINNMIIIVHGPYTVQYVVLGKSLLLHILC